MSSYRYGPLIVRKIEGSLGASNLPSHARLFLGAAEDPLDHMIVINGPLELLNDFRLGDRIMLQLDHEMKP